MCVPVDLSADPDGVAVLGDVGHREAAGPGNAPCTVRMPRLSLSIAAPPDARQAELMLDHVGSAELVDDVGVARGEPLVQHPLDDLRCGGCRLGRCP